MNTTIKIVGIVGILKSEAQNQLKALNAAELIDARQNGAVIIDIRREEEWKNTGIIQGAVLITAFQKDGSIHPNFQNKLFAAVTFAETPIVLYCRSGNRTNKIGNELVSKLGFTNVSHLLYGIEGWVKSEYKTITY